MRGCDFAEFPRTIQASSANPGRTYRRVKTHFAAHGHSHAADPTLEFAAEGVSVFPIDRYGEIAGASRQSTPVYWLAKGGTLAVPTGRVFVRLAPDLKFEDHAERFRNAGYEIAETVSYAPNAGWLRPRSASIASSLTALPKLAAIPGVENAEPQMLTKAARKT